MAHPGILKNSSEASNDRLPAPGFGRGDRRPVIAWALLGAAAFLGLALLLIQWVVTGDAHPVPTGPTPVPTWMRVALHLSEVLFAAGALALLHWNLLRPKLRTGKFTSAGLVGLSILIVSAFDPTFNYLQPILTYNAEFLNLGWWGDAIPGWMSPNPARTPFPIVFVPAAYVMWFYGFALLGAKIMDAARRRWPSLGPIRLMAIVAFIACVCDVFFEVPMMSLGAWTHAGAPRWESLFTGTRLQLPLYEILAMGIASALWAGLIYFVDENGRTIVERGIDRLRLGDAAKTVVRFLAIFGATFVIAFGIGHLPAQWHALDAGAWPSDVSERSYFGGSICGPQTSYACPGPSVPIPRGTESQHVSPSGTLVAPSDSK